MTSTEQACDKLRRARQRMSADERNAAPELPLLLEGLSFIDASEACFRQLLTPLRGDATLGAAGAGEGLAPLLTPKYGAVFKVRRWQEPPLVCLPQLPCGKRCWQQCT